jgi:O-antigen ligase
MNTRRVAERTLSFIPSFVVAGLGILAGLILLVIAGAETRWLIYISGALLFSTCLLLVRDRQRFLWGVFVLSLQFNVSLRLLYGHAGSGGIALQAVFLAGLLLAIYCLFTRNGYNDGPLIWGGPLGFPIAVLFLSYILSLSITSERFLGFSYLLTQLQYYFIYWLVLNFVRTEIQLNRIIRLLLLVLAIQSIIYYIQNFLGITFTLTGEVLQSGELPRPGGTVSTNPSGFASFILPPIFLAAACFVSLNKTQKRRWHISILIGLAIGALILTLTRAAWGSFILGLGCFVILGYRRGVLSFRDLLMIGGFVSLAAIAAAPMIAARLEGAPLESSYNERSALWQMAINVIEAHPIAGVGPGAYGLKYTAYLTPELAGKWQSIVHNHYLLRTAENGIPGGIAFVLLLVAAFRYAVKLTCSGAPTIRAVALAASAGLLALSFEMFWDIWLGFSYNAMLWFILGLLGAAGRIEQRSKHKVPP